MPQDDPHQAAASRPLSLPPGWRALAGVGLLLAFALVGAALPARGSSFDVFCTDNFDGTQTCVGREGGDPLTCTRSRASTISCSSPSGRGFTCTQTLGGVISCSDPPSPGQRGGPRCVLTGDGNLLCSEEDQPSPPLLAPPTIPPAEEPLDAPALTPLLPGGLRIPSVFD